MKVEQDVPVAFTPVPFIYKPFDHSQIDVVSKEFYLKAMAALDAAGIPFLGMKHSLHSIHHQYP